MVYDIRNTPWNRFSHTKKVKANIQQKQSSQKIIDASSDFIKRVGDVTYTQGDFESAKVTGANSLLELLDLHKEIWSKGFRSENLGPNPHGVFRTENVRTMTPEQVWIGGWGLITRNIPHWERFRDAGKVVSGGSQIYDYLTLYQVVLMRYKEILTNGINKAVTAAKKDVATLKRLGY